MCTLQPYQLLKIRIDLSCNIKSRFLAFFRQEVMGGKVSTPVVMVTGAGAVGPSGWYVLQFAKIPTAPCSLTKYWCSVSWLASLFFLNLLGWIKPFLHS